MKDIIQIISNLEDMRFIKPASMEQIIEAEKELGVSFADDYTKYVEKYGVISARGIELTGVTTHERLSVVSITKKGTKYEFQYSCKYVCYREHCDRWYHSFAG